MPEDLASAQLAVLEERRRVCSESLQTPHQGDNRHTIAQGEGEGDTGVWDAFYLALCWDILRVVEENPSRSVVVSQAVYTRRARDVIRGILGDNLTFLILDIEPELQVETMDMDPCRW